MDHDALGDAATAAGLLQAAWGTTANSTAEYASHGASGKLI